MKITEIAFVCYAVSDLQKSRKFYEGLIGLKPTSVWESDDKKMGMIEYEIGPHCFAIGCGAPSFTPGPQGPTVALEVKDFEKAVEELKAAKVKFAMKPAEHGVCWMALVKDPSGNQLMIHRRKTAKELAKAAAAAKKAAKGSGRGK